MNPIPTSFSVRDLQRRYRDIINTAKRSKDAVVLINNSRPEAVVLDTETYDELIRDTYPYDEMYVKKVVERSRSSIKKDGVKKLRSWNELAN
jgi:PHD/YefM family antitoxin component YafN of YafNO toxin-antitoxin module